ncbi:hypothetical protein ACIQRW_02620 [Streptomyces sp. NPDC091287]|uniref:hypothetical protein n=1 Tax=Streptomyces sp. NPDC091287 TaxID=3365988 RepID=UPI00381AA4D9
MSSLAEVEPPVASGCGPRVIDAARLHATAVAADELRRLHRRGSLTSTQRAEVATALRRLTDRLVLMPLTAWKGDPNVAADLFGLPLPRPSSSEGSAS